MRTHKFMILVNNHHDCYEEYMSDDQYNRLETCEDYQVIVIKCNHEEFEDNLVVMDLDDDYDGYLVKDSKGKLYLWSEVFTQTEVVTMWGD